MLVQNFIFNLSKIGRLYENQIILVAYNTLKIKDPISFKKILFFEALLASRSGSLLYNISHFEKGQNLQKMTYFCQNIVQDQSGYFEANICIGSVCRLLI